MSKPSSEGKSLTIRPNRDRTSAAFSSGRWERPVTTRLGADGEGEAADDVLGPVVYGGEETRVFPARPSLWEPPSTRVGSSTGPFGDELRRFEKRDIRNARVERWVVV
jgi:hypothetical protein